MLTPRRVDRGRLKALRVDRGLTHDGLAALIKQRTGHKAAPEYLSRIETGHPAAANVTDVYLGRIAVALGVSVDEFSTREPIEDAA